MKNRNSIAKEIARELRSGNRMKCQECNGAHPRRKVYQHKSGVWLCNPHLTHKALNGRRDFRTREAK